MSNKVDFGKALRVVRTARGMTQKDVAIAANTTGGYISFIESNSKTPSTEMIEAIAKALHIPVWMLVMLGSDESDLAPLTPTLALEILQKLVANTSPPSHPPTLPP